jgi:fatty-acyl-CoA synthase
MGNRAEQAAVDRRQTETPRTLAQRLAQLAARRSETVLLTFLDPEREDHSVTAGELDRDARAIAAALRDAGVRPREIVPLVFDHGYELVATFWGAMYAGAIPTILPYLSREGRTRAYVDHVARLVRFVSAPTVVTTGSVADYLRDGLRDQHGVTVLEPRVAAAGGADGAFPPAEPIDPPYIQFSSGTTDGPKGVCLTHAALLRFNTLAEEMTAMGSGDVSVGWLPLYHDMGLLTQILDPLSAGRHSVIMSPPVWLREPHRLFQAIHRFRGTSTWMPNFAFRYCTQRVHDRHLAGVDLSSWRIVGNGSERVSHHELEAFARRFAPYGLKREALTVSYGMAEHIAGITWTPHDRFPDVDWVSAAALERGVAEPAPPDDRTSCAVVSCGYPMHGVTLHVTDATGAALGERRVGEIFVQSPMLFSGYYALPEETAATVRDDRLRTGDVGYLANGQLYVCGRKKDLIIVGGRNIHPTDIEAIAGAVLGEHARAAAAFAVPNRQLGTETPVLVCEMHPLPDEAAQRGLQQDIRARIGQALRLTIADIRFVDRGWVVRTTSGKINRSGSRDKYLAESSRGVDAEPPAEGAAAAAGATDTERRLLAIWRGLFPGAEPTVDADFFALGGDSLLAVQMAVAIEETFRRELPATALVGSPTIAALARLLDAREIADEDETLVPLQPATASSTRPPFFCVHGIGGGVLDYHALSQALGAEQPFYGLQGRGIAGGEIDADIEVMARRYIDVVKRVQSRGPYHLGGYCYGGIVAFEMARQLRAAGDDVALVAIIEGYAPRPPGAATVWREWRIAADFIRGLPFWLRDYLQLGRMHRRARNRRLRHVMRRRMLRLLGRDEALAAAHVIDDLDSRPAAIQRAIETHLAAGRRYVARRQDTRLVLVRTPQRLLEAPEHDMGWGALSTQPVTVEVIPGTHATILREPHVDMLAQKLAPFLAPDSSRGAVR